MIDEPERLAPIEFQLSAAEHRRLERTAYAGVLPNWFYLLLAGLYLVQFIEALARHGRHDARATTVAVMFGVAAVSSFLMFARVRFRHIPAAGVLTFTDAGLRGTLDGKPVSIPWRSVASATDRDDAFVIVRRGIGVPIVIPKAALVDPAALWSTLDDRLVAKRGLVRSARPRRLIVNSAS